MQEELQAGRAEERAIVAKSVRQMLWRIERAPCTEVIKWYFASEELTFNRPGGGGEPGGRD